MLVNTTLVLWLIFSEPDKPAFQTIRPPENPASADAKPAAETTLPAKTPQNGYLCVVIDDVGNSIEPLNEFLKFPGPLTLAVMPQRRFTEEAGRLIKAAGKALILHQPMQPFGAADPGPGAVTLDMSEKEIRQTLAANISQLPGLTGVNNHMGSALTSDSASLTAVLRYLKERDLLFVDSYTSSKSVAKEVAASLGAPTLRRDSDFLDNKKDPDSIEKAFKSGLAFARQNGHALLIGHINSPALLAFLNQNYLVLQKEGYSFVDLDGLRRALNDKKQAGAGNK